MAAVDTFRHHFEGEAPPLPETYEPVFEIRDLAVGYGGSLALTDVSLKVPAGEVTAIIGPSGCGKSTLLRSLNRMNDEIPGAAVAAGSVLYRDEDIYAPGVDQVALRRRVGMVFQRPQVFEHLSIYENVAFGPKAQGRKKGSELDEIVEESLGQAALWDRVKDELKEPATGLSGGEQQRLCLARALAANPDVILMDEPCAALDPISTAQIEEVIGGLAGERTVVVVTHNMQQAARVSHRTAFMSVDPDRQGKAMVGRLVEFGSTAQIFTNPQSDRTEGYITGKFG